MKHLTFETFEKTEKNSFAYAVACSMTDKSSERISGILYIYGSEQIGKTHLLSAVLNRAEEEGLAALYTKAADLVKKREAGPADLVLVDNVEETTDREKENLVFLVNRLAVEGKRILLAERCEEPDETVKQLHPDTVFIGMGR